MSVCVCVRLRACVCVCVCVGAARIVAKDPAQEGGALHGVLRCSRGTLSTQLYWEYSGGTYRVHLAQDDPAQGVAFAAEDRQAHAAANRDARV